jgi:N-acetylmuramic acid 6-phosphate etherase
MSTPKLLIGIDGGGSKTLALMADEDGRVLGRGAAGSSNYQSMGAAAAQDALNEAIAAACLAVGPPAALCLGLAGVDRPEDRAFVQGWLARAMPGIPAAIVNDAKLVLAAGTPEGWGAALICGTGSIAYGEDAEGRRARAGGWGYLMGDEGSGYAIGQAALRAVLRAFDGRGAQTALTRAVLAHWGLSAPPDLVGRVYRENLAPADLAALAPLVEAAATSEDAVSQEILRGAGHELALAVKAVVRSLTLPEPTPCALAGGLIVRGEAMRLAFVEAARVIGLRLDPVTPVAEPAQGAVRLARELLRRGGVR